MGYTCAKCGEAIPSLPFVPRKGSKVLCRKCYGSKKFKDSGMPEGSENRIEHRYSKFKGWKRRWRPRGKEVSE